MSRTYQLQINNPCTEDWGAMLPEEKGKFCLSCQKSVIDFSVMSDAAIVRVLEQHNGALCGRIKTTQQQRDLSINTPNANFLSRVWKYAVSLSFVIGSYTAVAKEKQSNKIELTPIAPDDVAKIDSAKEYLKGVVIDQDGELLPGAIIEIKHTEVTVVADDFGIFTLSIPKELQQQAFTIVIRSFGNELLEKEIKPDEYQQNQLLVTMYYDKKISGQVGGAFIMKKRHWWQFWKPKYY